MTMFKFVSRYTSPFSERVLCGVLFNKPMHIFSQLKYLFIGMCLLMLVPTVTFGAVFGGDDRENLTTFDGTAENQLYLAVGTISCFDGHRSTAFLIDIDDYVETSPDFHVVASTANALYDVSTGMSRGRCTFSPAYSADIRLEIKEHLVGQKQMIGIRDGDWLFGRMDGNIGMGKPLPILFGDIYDFNPDQVRELQAVGFAQDLAMMALTNRCYLDNKDLYDFRWQFQNELSKMVVHDCDFVGSAWGGPLTLKFEEIHHVIAIHAGDGRVRRGDGSGLTGVPYDPRRGFYNYSRRLDLFLEEKLIAFISRFTHVKNPSPSITARSILIRNIQINLNRLGYDSGKVDGLLGSKTTEAVRAFQTTLGITPTGRITEELLLLLEAK